MNVSPSLSRTRTVIAASAATLLAIGGITAAAPAQASGFEQLYVGTRC